MPTLPKTTRPYWNPKKPQEFRSWDNPWYHTRRWLKASKQCRFLDYPKCTAPKPCINYSTCKTLSQMTDHIKPVSTGNTMQEKEYLMWDESNHQPMCNHCHAIKSGKETK